MNSCEILLRRVPSVWEVAVDAIVIEQPSSDRETTALRIRESWCAWDDSIGGSETRREYRLPSCGASAASAQQCQRGSSWFGMYAGAGTAGDTDFTDFAD